MCGIAGIVNFPNGINSKLLKNMTACISHRGPDDEGYVFVAENRLVYGKGQDSCIEIKRDHSYLNVESIKGEEFFLGMGHRRLSIIDVSSEGHQPMYRDGCVIVFNGEIYNYLEIKSELVELGMSFKTETDTEVILAAYQRWGEDCVSHFNGMWAFAIWDAKERKLFCSRDRFGVKPFYYYLDTNKFVFGSEIKEIIQDSTIDKVMDEETLAVNLIYGVCDYNERTLIKDIVALKAGHNFILTVDKNYMKIDGTRLEQYWDISFSNQTIDKKILGQEIERSIKYRLRSDVPVGALLSGGLDSSSLVTLICRQLKSEGKRTEEFQTFTACYDDAPEHDERKFAHLVNVYNGCKENLIFPQITEVEKNFEAAVWHLEGIASFKILGTFAVIEAASNKGIKVIINGQNGDETLMGYERYYAFYFMDLIKRGRLVKFLKEYYRASKHSKYSLKTLLLFYFYFCFPFVRKLKKRMDGKKYIKQRVFKSLNKKLVNNLLFPHNLNQLMYNELKATQLPHIIRMDDRSYMKYSVESRIPFLDYEYVEKAVNVLPEEKIKNGYTKNILREYMDDKMPKEVTWRTDKKGFSSPAERWACYYSNEYMENLFRTARSKKYFDIDAIKEVFQKDPGNHIISDFLSVELFMRLFHVQVSE